MSAPCAIQTREVSRNYEIRRKAEGLTESLKGLFWPEYSTLTAVNQLDLEIQPGEIVGFLGPNGAGKTTTLKMLSGLLEPTAGSIQVLGFEPFRREVPFLQAISLVMGQKQNLWWDLPPIEALAIHREVYDIPGDEYKRRVAELVDLLEIGECIEVQARKLSLGQRMRCELATALLHQPRVLFLDEPTIGLDILMQKKIRRFLLEYHQRFQPTIILTSHYMEDVAALAQRVVVINRGKKVYDDTLARLTAEARPERMVTVTFREVPAAFQPETYGELIRRDGFRFIFRVERQKVGCVAARLYSSGLVHDLIVEEPPLEETMAHLFSL
jgi:ABC-2 type transport system ATP-binding protein